MLSWIIRHVEPIILDMWDIIILNPTILTNPSNSFPPQESKRAWVIPSKVEPLYTCWWDEGTLTQPYPSLQDIRENVQKSLKTLRQDHKRSLNPTPYKVSQTAVLKSPPFFTVIQLLNKSFESSHIFR